MSSILVIDAGTTYLKAALVGRDGRMLASTRLAVPVAASSCGRAELPAEAFVHLITHAIGEVGLRSPDALAGVEAVTFASQTNSFLLLDGQNRPLTPIILWPDRRAESLDVDLAPATDLVTEGPTGVPAVPRFFMAPKLVWLRRHEPQTYRSARRLCLIGDYLAHLFTGRHVSEAGLAGLTGLLDIRQTVWLPGPAQAFGVPLEWLPEVVRAGGDLGPIAPTAARRWGLPLSCRFVMGCLDQYAGAMAAANVENGRVSETTGTVLATVRYCDRYERGLPASVFQGPGVLPGEFFRLTFGDTSAAWLEWLRERAPGSPPFDQLIASAGQVSPGAEGLRMRPEADVRNGEDAFVGLAPRHTHAHQVRCVLESVASALRGQVGTLFPCALPDEIRSMGGGARSSLWLQIKADVLGATVRAVDCPEPTSLGAAILAEAALQRTDVRQVASAWMRLGPPHHPDPARHRAYADLGL